MVHCRTGVSIPASMSGFPLNESLKYDCFTICMTVKPKLHDFLVCQQVMALQVTWCRAHAVLLIAAFSMCSVKLPYYFYCYLQCVIKPVLPERGVGVRVKVTARVWARLLRHLSFDVPSFDRELVINTTVMSIGVIRLSTFHNQYHSRCELVISWVQIKCHNHLLFLLAHSKNELMQWRGVRHLSVCKVLRKSLLLADKWPNHYQTFTRWTPGQRASRVCSRSRSRSKVTWYAHFLGFLEWATPSLTVWFRIPRVNFRDFMTSIRFCKFQVWKSQKKFLDFTRLLGTLLSVWLLWWCSGWALSCTTNSIIWYKVKAGIQAGSPCNALVHVLLVFISRVHDHLVHCVQKKTPTHVFFCISVKNV